MKHAHISEIEKDLEHLKISRTNAQDISKPERSATLANHNPIARLQYDQAESEIEQSSNTQLPRLKHRSV